MNDLERHALGHKAPCLGRTGRSVDSTNVAIVARMASLGGRKYATRTPCAAPVLYAISCLKESLNIVTKTGYCLEDSCTDIMIFQKPTEPMIPEIGIS